MSRARQVANFDPALLAADEVSGDKVHGGTISGSPVLVTPNIGTPNAGVVTNLSGVLPAGVTGGSGLTALGTVTVGNLSNTAIVYPDGHVLQTVRGTHNTELNTNSTSYVPTGLYASITPSVTGNKVLVQVNSSILLSMGTTVGYVTIYANHADGSTMVNIDGTASATSNGYANLHTAVTGGEDIMWGTTVTELHSPGTSGTAIRYEMYVRSSSSSQNVHWSQNASRSTIILQEIVA